MEYKYKRAIKLIRQAIETLDLDMSGLVVLTEVGSDNYMYSPVIACLAGAEHVYAWTADSAYGSGDKIKSECLTLLDYLGFTSNITITVNERVDDHIRKANVITNSGFVRPIDKNFLSLVERTSCVISLMYEAWEARSKDVDISSCEEFGVRVAGTWESYPVIDVFSGVGPLSAKLAFNAGFEVYKNKIVIWSGDHFGAVSMDCFTKLGAKEVVVTTDLDVLYREASDADFLYFCDMHGEDELIGEAGKIDLDYILNSNEILGIVHLIGDIDNEYILSKGGRVFPNKRGFCSVMSESLAHLGEMPVLNLQVAGFKVGELLYKRLEHPLVQSIVK